MYARELARGVRRTGGPRKMQVSVSPEGAVYAPGTEAFFERIGYSNPDFDASDYVVRNLGFVSIVPEIKSAGRDEFRPERCDRQRGLRSCLAEHERVPGAWIRNQGQNGLHVIRNRNGGFGLGFLSSQYLLPWRVLSTPCLTILVG